MDINYTTLLIVLLASSTLFFAYVYFRMKYEERIHTMYDYMSRISVNMEKDVSRIDEKINVMQAFINKNSKSAYCDPRPTQNDVELHKDS
jgi:predicted negative regulator of RcsB-dependent stress response